MNVRGIKIMIIIKLIPLGIKLLGAIMCLFAYLKVIDKENTVARVWCLNTTVLWLLWLIDSLVNLIK